MDIFACSSQGFYGKIQRSFRVYNKEGREREGEGESRVKMESLMSRDCSVRDEEREELILICDI